LYSGRAQAAIESDLKVQIDKPQSSKLPKTFPSKNAVIAARTTGEIHMTRLNVRRLFTATPVMIVAARQKAILK
jgi:hypothetical protein